MRNFLLLLTILLVGLTSHLNAQALQITLQNPAEANCNEEIRVDVLVNNFDNLFSAQFSINWNDNLLVLDRIENIHALFGNGVNDPGFGTPASSMIADNQMTFAWFDASVPNGLSIPDNEVLFSIFYTTTNNAGQTSPIELSGIPTLIEATNTLFTSVGIIANNSSLGIIDNNPPSITCPNNQSITIPVAQNNAVIDNIGAITNDNCGIDEVTYTMTGATIGTGDFTVSGQSFNMGTTVVTYNVTDFSNHQSTCSFEVIVNNQLTSDLDLIVNTDASNCSGQAFTVDIEVQDFTALLGLQFSVNWDATTLDFQEVISTNSLTGFLNFDETQVSNGILTLSWFDIGNIGGLTLTDNTAIFSIVFEGENNSITPINITNSPMTIEIIGSNMTVSTNINVQNSEVTVEDNINPSLTCPGNRTLTVAQGQANIIVNNIDPTADDNCGISQLTYQMTGATANTGNNSASGESFNLGTTVVEYTAKDNSWNTTNCEFSIFVVDDSPLEITIVADDTECSNGTYTVDFKVQHFTNMSGLQFSVNWDATLLAFESTSALILQPNGNFTTDNTLLDNGILTFSWFDNSDSNGMTLLDGATIFSVNFSVVGSSGNTSTISITDNTLQIEAIGLVNNTPYPVGVLTNAATISIIDTEVPTVNCQNITRNLGGNGIISINPADLEMSSTDNCSSTLSSRLSMSSFACGDLGTNMVTLTVQDASGNEASCTALVTITDHTSYCSNLFNPIIGDRNLLLGVFGANINLPPTISDPCVCRNNVPSIINGATSDAGLFSDEVLIVSQTPGDQWGVIGTADSRPLPFHYNTDLSLQAADLTRVQIGDVFNGVGSFIDNNGDTYYIYSLKIVHQDNEGYSLAARESNGTYISTEQVSNLCLYPDPIITNIRSVYSTDCEESVTIIGVELNSVVPDYYTLRIDGPDSDLPLIVSGLNCQTTSCPPVALTFVPEDLDVGLYTATFTFDAGLAGIEDLDLIGCRETVIANFEIVSPPLNLVCNSHVQVSLNELCSSTLTPDAILEGDQDNYDLFEVEVRNQQGQNIGNTVGFEYIGQTLTVAVRDLCSDNLCWGTISIEDKLAPRFECGNAITVACTADLDTIAPPLVIDNCDATITPVLVNESYENLDCADGLVARLVRTWRATDGYDNISDNCEQVINIQKFSLDAVVFPPHYDNNQQPALACDNANTDPLNTGFPTIEGGAINGDDVCRMVASSEDQIIETCGNSYKILRTWTIYDWCMPLENGINPREYLQIIKVEDASPPIITCPSVITIGATNNDCTADVNLREAAIFDLCSNFTVRVATSYEFLETNGGSVNLPLGIHSITYTATDDCNNSASCETLVEVIDNVEPVAVCDQFTVVTLNSSGTVLANATSFDDGSYDNCTGVIFSARRMDGNSTFADTVPFDCNDIANNPIQVIFRVTDENGNENFCMVQVEVQDKTDPVINCPADITIDCSQDPFDMDLTGLATVSDACTITLFNHIDVANDISSCGEGAITRVFRAEDSNNNESNCVQFIYVSNTNDPFDLDNIDFPEDINFINQCGVSVEPDDLSSTPTNYSRPIIDPAACAMVAVSYEDERLYLSVPGDTACYKILRTWKVIDWCQYDPNAINPSGRFEHVQVIKVLDEQAPIVDCPSDFTIDITSTDDCLSGTFGLPLPTFTDCSVEVNINISGDLGSSTSISNIPPGEYDVTYSIADGCGNTTTCEIIVTVRDVTGPSGVCDNLATIPMTPIGMVSVSATQFVIASSVQDNCTASEDIIISYSMNVADSVATFTCTDLGINTVEIWALDEDGNWKQLCSTTIEIQDGSSNCTGGLLASISGVLQTETGQDVENADVGINGSSNGFNNVETTGPDGTFSFIVPMGGDYTVNPDKDIHAINGVSTFDLVLMSKHILDITPLHSPYRWIAADVNNSGMITTLDMVQVRKLILNMIDEFADVPSWRFILADYAFENPDDPLADALPEVFNVNDLTEDIVDADFIAIKMGDVNNSAIPNLFATIDDRTMTTALDLVVENQAFQNGEEIIVPITSRNFNQIVGLQAGLGFNQEKLEFVAIESGLLEKAQHFGLRRIEEGVLTFSWNEATELSLSTTTVLFYLKFKATGAGTLEDDLAINTQFTQAEAYQAKNGTIDLMDVELNYRELVLKPSDAVVLFQNEPNPFTKETKIRFYLPETSLTYLTIFDFSGQKIWQLSEKLDQGYHNIAINSLRQKGIFYYQLETQTEIITRKMIKLD